MSLELRDVTPYATWGVWKMEESEAELFRLLPSMECIADSIDTITHSIRRVEFLTSRVLVGRLLGMDYRISYSPEGRPSIVSRSPYLHISISHTRGYVAVYLHTTHAVGIDIEQINPRIEQLAPRFMAATELANVDEQQRVNHLLLHWSAKESVFKALEQSDVDFRKQLHISPFVPANKGAFSAFETKTPHNTHFVINYIVDSDYVLTKTVNYSCQISHEA